MLPPRQQVHHFYKFSEMTKVLNRLQTFVIQQVKTLPVASASHMWVPVQVPVASPLIQLPVHVPWKAGKMVHILGLLHPHGSLDGIPDSWFWPNLVI